MLSQREVISIVSSTASSLIVLFIIFTYFKFASLTRYAPSVRDIFAPQMRYCFAVRNSDIFAFGECGGKYATYKSSRRAVRGISLAVRQISQAVLISQIREDLYRFSLSASSDKLNFPHALSQGTSRTDKYLRVYNLNY